MLVLPALLPVLALPLGPAPMSDDESWVSETAGDELAGEAESCSGDVPRVADVSWHCKVSEARMGPAGEVAQVMQRVSKEKAAMTCGSRGVAASGLPCLLQDGCKAAAPAWLREPEMHPGGTVTLPPSGFPPPQASLSTQLERPCTNRSLGGWRSTTAGQRQHDRWRGARIPQAYSSVCAASL